MYYDTGEVLKEIYWDSECIQREDGPAVVEYTRTGHVVRYEFWLGGEQMGFWDIYDLSTEENQKILLKKWLLYA
jgi:hypothetical protein